MASKTFEVKDFRIALHRDYHVYASAAMVRCSGKVLCIGRPRGAAADFRLEILFVPADAEMPPNTTDFVEHEARIYLRESRLPSVLALLQADTSIYAHVSDNHPLSNQIRTSFDPVDES